MFKNKKVLILLFVAIISIVGGMFLYEAKTNIKDAKQLINISKKSKKFMNNYFEEVSELKKEDKENTLIVISSKKIKKEDYGAKDVIEGPNNKYYLVFDDETKKENAIHKLNEEPTVLSTEENRKYELFVENNDNNEQSYNSWGIEAMGLDYASDLASSIDAPEVVVAIIDTGLDEELFNKYYPGKLKGTYNVLDSNDSMYDNDGHGTHIAGTIAEGTPDNVKVLPIKIGDIGDFFTIDVIEAIEYITYYECADVINMSLGSSIYSEAEYQAIQAAYEKNIISVAAAGNASTTTPEYPAYLDNTISVSAVDRNLNISAFSNYGNTITFAAPGEKINSIMSDHMYLSAHIDNDSEHETLNGTSMAAPHVSAAVAILKLFNKNLSMDNVIELLKNNAIDLGAPGYDSYYGYGMIDFSKTLLCSQETTSCDRFEIFKVNVPSNMSVNVEFSHYNYGSISNLLLSTVIFEEVDGQDYQKQLWELDDISITGYDPYSVEVQNITIKYGDLEATVNVKNPTNYETAWEYIENNGLNYLSGYRDGNDILRRIYLPEKINNIDISGIINFSDSESNLFGNSEDANNFNEIIIPENYTSIGDFAFASLPNVNKIVINGDQLTFGMGSMSNMKLLSDIVGNLNLTDQSVRIFENDTLLTNVNISNSTTIIPNSAFKNCESLLSIIIPNSVENIDDNSFDNSGLKHIAFPNNLIRIGLNAFKNSDLNEIQLPISLQKIDNYAFSNNKLVSVTIPKNVNEIGIAILSGNPIETIVVAEDNNHYDSRNDSNLIIETSTNKIIQGTPYSRIIPNTVLIIGKESYKDFDFLNSSVGNLFEIPEGVTTIESGAFENAEFLGNIMLPQTISLIDNSAFDNDEFYTKIIFWVHENSYSYNYVLNNDRTYIIVETALERFHPKNFDAIYIEDNKNHRYHPGDTADISNVLYCYLNDQQVFVDESITEYEIEYQSGDNLKINDYEYYVKLSIENGFQNYKKAVGVWVGFEISPINLLIGESLKDISTVQGENFTYGVNVDGGVLYFDNPYVSFDEPGEYSTNGHYVATDENYEDIYNFYIPIHVIDKRVVAKSANIRTKMYDGTTYVDPETVTLNGLDKNSYTVVSATLADADNIGNEASVTLRIRLTDDAYENYAFSGDVQEAEWTTTMSVADLDLPQIELLLDEQFSVYWFEEGNFVSYTATSFSEPGDYTILGYYNCNDGSCSYEDIKIQVHVINKHIAIMWPVVSPKSYDGTTNIDINTITMDTTMPSDKYVILSAETNDPNVSNQVLGNVRVRLTDDTYEEYAFSGNKQEENFMIMLRIIKGTPNYIVPTGLTGNIGQKLSDIALPSGFEWMNSNETIEESGNLTYKARYTPEDTDNYEIVENINITILVASTTEDDSFDYIIHKYSVDETNKYISKIMVNTTVDTLKDNIELNTGYSVEVDYKTINDKKLVYTGGKTKIYKGSELYREYTNIVVGDINGDAAINSADLLKIRQHLLSINILSGPYFIASDINYDSNINSADLLRVRQHLLGTKPIE